MQLSTIGPRIDVTTDRRRSFALPAVLLLHLVLLWLLHRSLLAPQAPSQATSERQPAARLIVRWLPLRDEPSPPAAAPAAVPLPALTPRPTSKPMPALEHTPPAAPTLKAPSPLVPPHAAPAITTPSEPWPSASPASPLTAPAMAPTPPDTPLLDSAATRRAIRESARQPGSAAQRAVEDGAALRAPTAEARLPGAMERSGKGDCAKGEFAGSGMYLLSLPFLAAAAIKGDCAK